MGGAFSAKMNELEAELGASVAKAATEICARALLLPSKADELDSLNGCK